MAAKNLKTPKSVDTTQFSKFKNTIIAQGISEGYPAISIDTIFINKQSQHAEMTLYTGPKFTWNTLTIGKEAWFFARKAGLRSRKFEGHTLNVRKLALAISQTLEYAQNNGYPFAAVHLDSLNDNPHAFSARLRMNTGALIRIDSIIIKSENKLDESLVKMVIGIEEGDIFDQSRIDRIVMQIRSTGYLKVTKSPEVEFGKNGARLFVYVNSGKASYANGILGILPDADNEKVTLTGDIRVSLKNGLGKGELIDVNWRRLQTQTQDFRAAFMYPYLFGSPFSPDTKLKIYKRDSTFLEVDGLIGFRFMFRSSNSLKASYRIQQYAVLNQERYEGFTTLPPLNDTRSNLYSIGIEWNSLNYRFNPIKGVFIEADLAGGNRRIIPNPLVDETVYADQDLNAPQLLVTGNLQYFIPLGKRFTIQLAGSFGHRMAKTIFENELFRLGGLQLLRGFDEETIRATSYFSGTAEFRFLLEENSYLFAFFDKAWYEQRLSQSYLRDLPRGIGTGIAFDTKAGIFSINVALGQQLNNPVDLRSSKVHFGFINFF